MRRKPGCVKIILSYRRLSMYLSDIIYPNEILNRSSFSKLEFSEPKNDSGKVSRGDIFFACGVGKAYMHEAYTSGARAIVCEDTGEDYGRFPIPVIFVENAYKAYAVACQRMRGCPAHGMTLIAVTGTNGKTSTAMILKSILEESGIKTGVIGTLGNFVGDVKYDTAYTTPPPEILAELLALMKDAGVSHVIMEASSHALDQYRLAGLHFEVGIFTNLTRDHLDYHKTVDAYAKAKSRLFENCENSVINLDDRYALSMAFAAKNNVYYCSTENNAADFYAENILCDIDGISYTLISPSGMRSITAGFTGKFYVCNTMYAYAAAELLGIDDETICKAIKGKLGIDGRMEAIKLDDATVVIDFAHTPDALEKALSALRSVCHGRLIAVFGCGGDRDKGKRSLMGRIADKYADIIILTSDNPRSENPEMIISDIASGIKEKKYIKITDRAAAISMAMTLSVRDDIILVSGKGHENYIEDLFGKHYFSDKETINNFVRKGM